MKLTFVIFFHDQDFFFLSQNPQGPTDKGLRVNMPELRQEDNTSLLTSLTNQISL